LVGTDLRSCPRSKPSDLFALAVHIHLLLMAGNHPFMRGTWTGPGEQPGVVSLAKAGEWAGDPHSRLHTHPLAPPISFLPSTIQDLFTRAFTRGATDPDARPSATEWRAALLDIKVTDCDRHTHQIPAGARTCPWCRIGDERVRRKSQPQQRPVERQTIHPVIAAKKAVPAAKTPTTPKKSTPSAKPTGKATRTSTSQSTKPPAKKTTTSGKTATAAEVQQMVYGASRPPSSSAMGRFGRWIRDVTVGVAIIAILVGTPL
jgi:DNA-binding helix-hairpin-helix protein with protein kinase domain